MKSILEELASTVKCEGKHLFTSWRELLGFRIGWLLPEIVAEFSQRYGFKTNECEIVMMQATGLTECHLHTTGASTFLVLGKEHGMPVPSGGTYMAPDSQKYMQELPFHKHSEGEIFEIPAGTVHAFAADPGGVLTLIGVVQPRIQQDENTFDVVSFNLVSVNPFIVRRAA